MRQRENYLGFLLAVICSFLIPGKIFADPIVDAAKKEGQIVFYTALQLPVAQSLAAIFEKKYPFLKVAAIRIGSENMATRLVSEAQANAVKADVAHQSGFDFYGVFQKGVFAPYDSPERAAFPPNFKDEKGYWIIHNATLNVIAYNTARVAPADVPKSFWDLTQPKWKGQMLMDENESKWMAGMIEYFGENKAMDLMRKLADQDIQFRNGHTLLATMVAAGDRAIAVVAFADSVEGLKQKGAPIDWVAVEPLLGLSIGLALVKNAPHPNAAKLFIDFLLSKEGQEAIAAKGYFSPRQDVQSPIMQRVPANLKVLPLSMTLAQHYQEDIEKFRKVMKLH